jgi:hypothetical protein
MSKEMHSVSDTDEKINAPTDAERHLAALQYVVKVKAAWRQHAQSLTWEEKVASIERMWVRDKELKKIRERNIAARTEAAKQLKLAKQK